MNHWKHLENGYKWIKKGEMGRQYLKTAGKSWRWLEIVGCDKIRLEVYGKGLKGLNT